VTVPDGIFLARPEPVGEGPRLAVKDLFDTAGLATTRGSPIFSHRVPQRPAEAVRRLEEAGWSVVGKTNLDEFAYGVMSENPFFGTVPNPRAPGRTAGGSSGGSAAAVAAGLADGALGTDSGGSIRIPAACCGVVGFKPSFGLVPLEGCFGLAPSFDHGGPIAASVDACARMMGALAPGDWERTAESLEEVLVGVAWLEGCEPLVRARVDAAAERFPRRREVELPFPAGEYGWLGAFRREAAEVHGALFAERADDYGAECRYKIERSLAVSDGDAAAGERGRAAYRARMAEAMEGLDLLLVPTLLQVAPETGARRMAGQHVDTALTRFTWPFNGLGWPALALPCGPAEGGLPASLQLVGRAGDDARVLAVGRRLEALLA
jgi:Asp-tRNA(Asn)/Glu-tRNA(Gln) amidotransferase A subunit family amidase